VAAAGLAAAAEAKAKAKVEVEAAGELWAQAAAEQRAQAEHLPQHSSDVSQEVVVACALRLKK
jgi:hypothetical protein